VSNVKRLGLLLLAVAACSDASDSARAPLNLDRPVDLAFGCWGGLRIVGANGTAEVGDEVITSAQPMASCAKRSEEVPSVPPDGQETLDGGDSVVGVDYFAFVVQSVPGTVAVSTFDTKPASAFTGLDVAFVDSDPLTPGRNSIAVGSLPIAIAADRDGCHMITANAGSCDLSVIDIASVVDGDEATPPDVRSLEVTNGLGEPILARPAAMISEPAGGTIGVACEADPQGLVYVAYPDCHLVAAIRAGTGVIESGLRFNDDGTVDQITGDQVTCPAQCGGGGVVLPGERPTTLDVMRDDRVGTTRLAIGAENNPNLTIVELDPITSDLLSFTRVTLAPSGDGDVGVIDVALTEQIGMGGSTGMLDDDNGLGGQHQFIYAIATDATVRVVEVLGTNVECDTQIDPRFLRGVADVNQLACFHVGDPLNPPRRPLARGPGIELVANAIPMAVATVSVQADETGASVDPSTLIGHFAFVTATTGETVIINIDDDNYADFWEASAPIARQLPLALAHQVRDAVENRADLADTTINAGTPDEETVSVCDDNGPTDQQGGPRIAGGNFDFGFAQDKVNPDKGYVLPGIRRIECVDGTDGEATAISSLSFSAPIDQRDLAFPDWRGLRLNETWNLTWEGSLSRDESDEAIDGPIDHSGVIARDGQQMTVTDPSRPFCAAGAQPYDIVVLSGCDPSVGDAECRIGETCYVHPDATFGSGTCLPVDEADLLAGTCRDFLISQRRFSIVEADAGELRVVPRRRVLAASPLDGCVDDAQCVTLAQYEASLAADTHPIDDTTPPSERTYACEADPSRAPGPDRCVMTCEADADCEAGTRCDGGYCVEGVIPPAACATGVQRYQVRAGDAYAVIGNATGYLHPIIEDDSTGACVVDPTASPLLIGRLPLTAPPCTGDGFTDLLPNPCSVTVDHTELVPDYETGSCETETDNGELITRDAPAIRFRNPGLTFELVDPYYPGDAMCREDRAGTLGMIPVSVSRHQLEFTITQGFFTKRADLPSVFPVNVVRGPEQSIWVIDEGDNVPDASSSLSTRGQVFRIETANLNAVNVVQ